MIDHHENVRKAHDEDDLMFGTVESWILYVGPECFSTAHTRADPACSVSPRTGTGCTSPT